MRRVIDDTHYDEIEAKITAVINRIPVSQVRKYRNGMDRVQVELVMEWIVERIPEIKLGHCEHAHGIGNNNAYEIIYMGNPKEEQICGLLHLTNDMYGGVYCWVSDIDEERRTVSRHMR